MTLLSFSLFSADWDGWTMCQATLRQSVAVDCRGSSSSVCAYWENKPKWADCSGSGPALVQPKVITSTSELYWRSESITPSLFLLTPFLKSLERARMEVTKAGLRRCLHQRGLLFVFLFFFLFPPRWVHAWCLTEHTSGFSLCALRLPFLIFLGADRTVVHDGYARCFLGFFTC